jgi:threonine/homoserine/homoserine lactone efflux protein
MRGRLLRRVMRGEFDAMAYLPVLTTLAGMHLLMAMLPGPNTVVISWIAARVSRGDGLKAAAGVVAGSLVWVILSLVGFGAVLADAGWLYRGLRLVGAGYLVFVGARLLLAGWRRPAATDSAAAAVATPGFAGRRPFVAGLLTNLSNPKSAVFWTSAFLVAVPPHAPAWVLAAIVAVIGVQTTLWYGAVALVLSTGVARRHYLRLSRRLDVAAGAVMVGLGLRIADDVRREIGLR